MKKLILPALLLAFAAAPAFAAPEEPARHGGHMMQRLEKADTNGDGAISRAEFTAFRAAQFDKRDTNHDGFLTADDKPMHPGKAPAAGAAPARFMAALDTNKDGKISRDEFVNGEAKMFDRLDTNKDGTISKAELDAAKAQAPAKR
jgi:hypothetical protein